MFSEVEASPWDTIVQRPTVDPNRKTTRDDTHLSFWPELVSSMPRLVGFRVSGVKSVKSVTKGSQSDTF